jgi:arylsulfatase A-like enzyme
MVSQAGGKAYFVHSLLSHRPYEFDRNGVKVRTLLSPDRNFEAMERDYEEQIMYLDRLLGDFIDGLKQRELFERPFIVITADHGPRTLGLRHLRNAFHDPSELPDRLNGIIPWIPLMIHGPDVAPKMNPAEYQHIDLLPTMLDLLEIPIPSDVEGISAFSLTRKERDKIFFAYPLKGGK